MTEAWLFAAFVLELADRKYEKKRPVNHRECFVNSHLSHNAMYFLTAGSTKCLRVALLWRTDHQIVSTDKSIAGFICAVRTAGQAFAVAAAADDRPFLARTAATKALHERVQCLHSALGNRTQPRSQCLYQGLSSHAAPAAAGYGSAQHTAQCALALRLVLRSRYTTIHTQPRRRLRSLCKWRRTARLNPAKPGL